MLRDFHNISCKELRLKITGKSYNTTKWNKSSSPSFVCRNVHNFVVAALLWSALIWPVFTALIKTLAFIFHSVSTTDVRIWIIIVVCTTRLCTFREANDLSTCTVLIFLWIITHALEGSEVVAAFIIIWTCLIDWFLTLTTEFTWINSFTIAAFLILGDDGCFVPWNKNQNINISVTEALVKESLQVIQTKKGILIMLCKEFTWVIQNAECKWQIKLKELLFRVYFALKANNI